MALLLRHSWACLCENADGYGAEYAHFHIGVLCFAFAEYLLSDGGAASGRKPHRQAPPFWCDMLLTLAILGLLPATRKAVAA